MGTALIVVAADDRCQPRGDNLMISYTILPVRARFLFSVLNHADWQSGGLCGYTVILRGSQI